MTKPMKSGVEALQGRIDHLSSILDDAQKDRAAADNAIKRPEMIRYSLDAEAPAFNLQNMANRVPVTAFRPALITKASTATPTTRMLLSVLATEFYVRDGRAQVSQAKLATLLGVGVKAVRDNLIKLREAGLIAIIPGEGRSNPSSAYFLNHAGSRARFEERIEAIRKGKEVAEEELSRLHAFEAQHGPTTVRPVQPPKPTPKVGPTPTQHSTKERSKAVARLSKALKHAERFIDQGHRALTAYETTAAISAPTLDPEAGTSDVIELVEALDPTAVIAQPTESAPTRAKDALRVATAIAHRFSPDTGVSTISHSTLGIELGMSQAAVQGHVELLRETGFLSYAQAIPGVGINRHYLHFHPAGQEAAIDYIAEREAEQERLQAELTALSS